MSKIRCGYYLWIVLQVRWTTRHTGDTLDYWFNHWHFVSIWWCSTFLIFRTFCDRILTVFVSPSPSYLFDSVEPLHYTVLQCFVFINPWINMQPLHTRETLKLNVQVKISFVQRQRSVSWLYAQFIIHSYQITHTFNPLGCPTKPRHIAVHFHYLHLPPPRRQDVEQCSCAAPGETVSFSCTRIRK